MKSINMKVITMDKTSSKKDKVKVLTTNGQKRILRNQQISHQSVISKMRAAHQLSSLLRLFKC